MALFSAFSVSIGGEITNIGAFFHPYLQGSPDFTGNITGIHFINHIAERD